MTAHPNAHILAQLAEIAKTDPEPWKRLEVQDIYGSWVKCGSQIAILNPDVILRIKPATVNIGGMELEGPLRVALADGNTIWLLFDPAGESGNPRVFTGRLIQYRQWLNQGRLFASKEARDRYQDALVKLANGSGT